MPGRVWDVTRVDTVVWNPWSRIRRTACRAELSISADTPWISEYGAGASVSTLIMKDRTSVSRRSLSRVPSVMRLPLDAIRAVMPSSAMNANRENRSSRINGSPPETTMSFTPAARAERITCQASSVVSSSGSGSPLFEKQIGQRRLHRRVTFQKRTRNGDGAIQSLPSLCPGLNFSLTSSTAAPRPEIRRHGIFFAGVGQAARGEKLSDKNSLTSHRRSVCDRKGPKSSIVRG
jgi:hypothetical protein